MIKRINGPKNPRVVVATITSQGVNLEIHGNEESFDQYYIGELRAQCPCLPRNY